MKKQGFSLVEVSLAILLIGIGLLTLFSLFPVALKESELAIEHTQEAMFADHVLSGIEGNAMGITSWTNWQAGIGFVDDIYPICTSGMVRDVHNRYVDFPEAGAGADARPVRYQVSITAGARGRKSVRLAVRSGRYGVFTNAQVFNTELLYMGM